MESLRNQLKETTDDYRRKEECFKSDIKMTELVNAFVLCNSFETYIFFKLCFKRLQEAELRNQQLVDSTANGAEFKFSPKSMLNIHNFWIFSNKTTLAPN